MEFSKSETFSSVVAAIKEVLPSPPQISTLAAEDVAAPVTSPAPAAKSSSSAGVLSRGLTSLRSASTSTVLGLPSWAWLLTALAAAAGVYFFHFKKRRRRVRRRR